MQFFVIQFPSVCTTCFVEMKIQNQICLCDWFSIIMVKSRPFSEHCKFNFDFFKFQSFFIIYLILLLFNVKPTLGKLLVFLMPLLETFTALFLQH